MEGIPLGEVCYNTCWLMGLWSTQAKVKVIMPSAAWHWGGDSSVVNEPGCTLPYAGLLSAWGPVDGDPMFFLIL